MKPYLLLEDMKVACISGLSGKKIIFYSRTNSPFRSMENAHDGAIYSLDWHPLGHILVSGSHDHATRFWTRSRPGERSEEDSVMKDEVAEEEPESRLPGLGKKPAAPISIPGLDRNIPGIGGIYSSQTRPNTVSN